MGSVPSSAILIVFGAIVGMLVITLGTAVFTQNRESGSKFTSAVDQGYQAMSEAANDYVIYNGKTVPGYQVKNCIKETQNDNITVTVNGEKRSVTQLKKMSDHKDSLYLSDTAVRVGQ